MLKRWKRLKSEVAFKNPWWTYQRDEFEIPDRMRGEYHYVHTLGSCMVVPRHADGRIVMVRQYRYLCDRESLEFPCGSVKEGHDILQTAQHELQEETGFAAQHLEKLGEFNPYNGVTDEICHVFLGSHLNEVEAIPDETEEFILEAYQPEEIDRMIRNHEIWDGMTMATWCLVRPQLV